MRYWEMSPIIYNEFGMGEFQMIMGVGWVEVMGMGRFVLAYCKSQIRAGMECLFSIIENANNKLV